MWQTGEDVEHLGRQLSCPVILYRPVQTLYHFPGGVRSPGLMTCVGAEGPGP
jgi:hypothetical protein